jgi:ATPase subunit of ABC transporter with duplicated ATPase domains
LTFIWQVKRRREIKRLQSENVAPEIDSKTRELRELAHRQTLAKHIDVIIRYVSDLAWKKRANRHIGSTYAITRKHDEIFDALVTEPYIELFRQRLGELGRPLRVTVGTRGQKGKTVRRIVLKLGDRQPSGQFPVEKVLSEGEKRIVALCDFMTEIATDDDNAGIILDDPVTSLDNEWKKTVAEWLVREAPRRQVIVFTHDLPFLYEIKTQADRNGVDVMGHWVKIEADGRPGHVYLDNSPICEQDYKSARLARDCYAESQKARPEEQESILKQGFGALRTCYEAFVIFDLLKEVVQRFSERISVGRLKDVVWDDAVAQAVVEKTDLLSRYIEGHSRSDEYAAVKPSPQLLLDEIEAFEELRKQHRKARKR